MEVRIATLGILIGHLAATAFATDTVASRQSTDRGREFRSQLDQDVPKWLAEYRIPSVSIAHIEDGRIVVVASYGVQSAGVAATPQTLYNIAAPTDADGKTLEVSIPDRFVASDDMHTTAENYAKFLLSVINREGLTEAVAKDRETIQLSRIADSCPPAIANTCPEDVGPGLGWEVFKFSGDTFLMHTGNDKGTFTFGYFSPTSHSGIVIFTNSSNGHQIVLPILDRLGKDPGFVAFLRATVN